MDMCTFLMALLIFKADAHMGITINDIFPREKAARGDSFRFPNGGVCDKTTAGTVQTTLAVGATITGRTTNGAGHGGGHCAWFVSADQLTWYKINDKIDCTPATQPTLPGGGTHDLVLPANLPAACDENCVLGWFWSPRFSGGCEVYHDCFDIKVTGRTGTPGTDMVQITTAADALFPGGACTRVNGAGITPMFGAMVGAGTPPTTDGNPSTPTSCVPYTTKADDTVSKIATSEGKTADAILAINPQLTGEGKTVDTIITPSAQKITLPPCSGGGTDCPTYTVVSGDFLSKIAAEQGTTLEKILEVNPQLTDPNMLAIGDVLKIPPCTSTTTPSGGDNGGGNTGGGGNPPVQTVKKCSCSERKAWCQQKMCNGAVQVNQCWGGGPFFFCMCSDGSNPQHDGTVCTEVCSGANCRSAFDVCTLPSTCVAGTPPVTCSDGIKNGQETGVDCGGDTCSACATYQWKISPWSSCMNDDKDPVTCGGGSQTRTVECVDASGAAASSDNCPSPTPATKQDCNTQDCASYSWKLGEWGECNVPCGEGEQFRSIDCVSSSGGSVSPTLCPSPPIVKQSCTGAQAKCGSEFIWKFGDWQFCDTDGCANTNANSLDGSQLREVFCYKSIDGSLADTASCDSGTKPTDTQTCTVTCPRSYTWKECPLTQCSSTCRGISAGFQERQVFCVNDKGAQQDESLCDLATRPPTFLEGCSPAPCTTNYWVLTPLGTCTTAADNCAQCIKLDGTAGLDSDCAGAKPSGNTAYDSNCEVVVEVDDSSATALTLPMTILISITVAFFV